MLLSIEQIVAVLNGPAANAWFDAHAESGRSYNPSSEIFHSRRSMDQPHHV
jgi:hypothetical protein